MRTESTASTPEIDAVVAEFEEKLREAIAAPLLKD
jgi:hypothetical protein